MNLLRAATDAAAAGSPIQDPIVVAALIGGVVAVIGAVATLIGVLSKSSADRKTQMETRLDQRISDELGRMDGRVSAAETQAKAAEAKAQQAQDDGKRHMRAVGRIFRRIQPMLPEEGPDLDPADIADLEDTEVLPPAWIRRRPGAAV